MKNQQRVQRQPTSYNYMLPIAQILFTLNSVLISLYDYWYFIKLWDQTNKYFLWSETNSHIQRSMIGFNTIQNDLLLIV